MSKNKPERIFSMWTCLKCGRQNPFYSNGKAIDICQHCGARMPKIHERINKFIEKQSYSRKAYSCVVCGRNHRLDSKLGQEHYQATQDWMNKPREGKKLSDQEMKQRLYNAIYSKEK